MKIKIENLYATCILSSASASNLEQSNILSCGKVLTLCHTIPIFNDPEKERF